MHKLCDEVMSDPVHMCRDNDTAKDCADLMREHNIGIVPIVDYRERLVGVITDRDLATRVIAQGKSTTTQLHEIMTSRPLATCRLGDDIETAEEQMTRLGTSRVIVTDNDGHPRGIIGLSDIASAEKPAKMGRIVTNVKSRMVDRHERSEEPSRGNGTTKTRRTPIGERNSRGDERSMASHLQKQTTRRSASIRQGTSKARAKSMSHGKSRRKTW